MNNDRSHNISEAGHQLDRSKGGYEIVMPDIPGQTGTLICIPISKLYTRIFMNQNLVKMRL